MTNQFFTDKSIVTEKQMAAELAEAYAEFRDDMATPKYVYDLLKGIRTTHNYYSTNKLKKRKLEKQAKSVKNIDMPICKALKQAKWGA